MVDLAAVLVVAIWFYLLLGRGGFWLGAQRDSGEAACLSAWPRVVAIIPARNEADVIGRSLTSVLRQDYPGELTVVVVDDDSSDGTALAARRAAAAAGSEARLQLVSGKHLSPGWTGKLWALRQGIEAVNMRPDRPAYVLLTDADIVHESTVLTWLVSQAESAGLVLISLMAKLRCESFAERSLIPAFIFFFQMLYPFSWVNRPDKATAAAAGGCMLVRTDALNKIGGIDIIRDSLIDDCALAKVLKAHGPIWLGLTERVRSIRPYPHVKDIRRMVARSAYAQLRYSPVLLLGTVAGMTLTFLSPVLLAVFASGAARGFGIMAWAMMAIALQPTLRLYRLSPLWGVALPAIAFAYIVYTLDSAFQFVRGRGGLWKGRVQASGS
jgi:hopene-associated glycosyltransferase HpnB